MPDMDNNEKPVAELSIVQTTKQNQVHSSNELQRPEPREPKVAMGPVGKAPVYNYKTDGNVFEWIVAAAKEMRPKELDLERFSYKPKIRRI